MENIVSENIQKYQPDTNSKKRACFIANYPVDSLNNLIIVKLRYEFNA